MSTHPSFIVAFKEGVSKQTIQEHADGVRENGGQVTHEYDLINAFAANIPENHLNTLQGHEHIKYIEPNGIATTQKKK